MPVRRKGTFGSAFSVNPVINGATYPARPDAVAYPCGREGAVYVQGESLKTVLPSTGGFELPAPALFAGMTPSKASCGDDPMTYFPTGFQDSRARFDNMDGNLDALKAFTFMLETVAHYDAGQLVLAADGLRDLVMPHIEQLSGHIGDLRAETAAAIRDQKAEEHAQDRAPVAWHDLDAIAAKSCVHKSEVARVLFVLTGEDHAKADYAAPDGSHFDGLAAHLLSMLISRTLSHGDIMGQVSTATGIDLMDLQDILEAMASYVPKRPAITLAERLERQAAKAAQEAAVDQVAAQLMADQLAPETRTTQAG
jgi:hypothetical protein